MDAASLANLAVALAADQQLEKRAMMALSRWFVQNDELPPGLTASEIQPQFRRCALVFRNSDLRYPYFETTLCLTRDGEEVGTFRLITTLGGEEDDDYVEWRDI